VLRVQPLPRNSGGSTKYGDGIPRAVQRGGDCKANLSDAVSNSAEMFKSYTSLRRSQNITRRCGDVQLHFMTYFVAPVSTIVSAGSVTTAHNLTPEKREWS